MPHSPGSYPLRSLSDITSPFGPNVAENNQRPLAATRPPDIAGLIEQAPPLPSPRASWDLLWEQGILPSSTANSNELPLPLDGIYPTHPVQDEWDAYAEQMWANENCPDPPASNPSSHFGTVNTLSGGYSALQTEADQPSHACHQEPSAPPGQGSDNVRSADQAPGFYTCMTGAVSQPGGHPQPSKSAALQHASFGLLPSQQQASSSQPHAEYESYHDTSGPMCTAHMSQPQTIGDSLQLTPPDDHEAGHRMDPQAGGEIPWSRSASPAAAAVPTSCIHTGTRGYDMSHEQPLMGCLHQLRGQLVADKPRQTRHTGRVVAIIPRTDTPAANAEIWPPTVDRIRTPTTTYPAGGFAAGALAGDPEPSANRDAPLSIADSQWMTDGVDFCSPAAIVQPRMCQQEDGLLKLLRSLSEPAAGDARGPLLDKYSALRGINEMRGDFGRTPKYSAMYRQHIQVPTTQTSQT